MTFRYLRRASLALLLSLAPVVAFAQGDCAELDGIEHCALGAANLSVAGDGHIIIDNIDGKTDGVSASFSEGITWTSTMSIDEDPDGGNFLTASARSEGEVTATNSVRRGDDGDLAISATFTGADEGRSYSLLVYNGGVLQGGVGGIGDGDTAFWIPTHDEDVMMWLIGFWGFHFRMANGGCEWELGLNEVRTLRLADGTQLEGDEIRLQEEVKGDGHYAYTGFDGIDIVGHATSLTMSSASVMP